MARHLILPGIPMGVAVAAAMGGAMVATMKAPIFSALFVMVMVQPEALPVIAISVIVGLLATVRLSSPCPGLWRGERLGACLTCPRLQYMFKHMKSLLVEVDDDLARRLEQGAPARSRRRSEFIRRAILAAPWEIEEQATAQAYARQPDSPDMAFDPTVWDASDGAASDGANG